MSWLDEKRKEFEQRMAELQPLVEEYERIKAAHAALIATPKRRGRPPKGSHEPDN